MLTLRLIGVRDYSVHDDGQQIGRIRFASERSPGNRRPPARRRFRLPLAKTKIFSLIKKQ